MLKCSTLYGKWWKSSVTFFSCVPFREVLCNLLNSWGGGSIYEKCFCINVKWCKCGGPCLLHAFCQHCNHHDPGVTVICWDRNNAKGSIYCRWFHIITEKLKVGKDLWRSLVHPHIPSSSVFKDPWYCSGTCSVKFWTSPVMEIPQPCWATLLVPDWSLLSPWSWWAEMT